MNDAKDRDRELQARRRAARPRARTLDLAANYVPAPGDGAGRPVDASEDGPEKGARPV